uniref:Uncharacterized protein n=1 Tax=Romanomermis culicivorax TaxID=13658 RepID=A0A915JZY4_ROMCU
MIVQLTFPMHTSSRCRYQRKAAIEAFHSVVMFCDDCSLACSVVGRLIDETTAATDCTTVVALFVLMLEATTNPVFAQLYWLRIYSDSQRNLDDSADLLFMRPHRHEQTSSYDIIIKASCGIR